MKQKLIKYFKENRTSAFTRFICCVYSFLSLNKFKIQRGNEFVYIGNFLNGVKIVVKGIGNKIIINPYGLSLLKNTTIYISGNNNIVKIGDRCNLINAEIWIEDSWGVVEIGTKTNILGRTHLACIEGSKIIIGDDCLFSTDVVFRTGDSHSILDNKTQKRINPSQDIIIGSHCWFGNKVTVLKGVTLGNDSIIATGSILTKTCNQSNVILAGSPAKIVKEDITWNINRITI